MKSLPYLQLLPCLFLATFAQAQGDRSSGSCNWTEMKTDNDAGFGFTVISHKVCDGTPFQAQVILRNDSQRSVSEVYLFVTYLDERRNALFSIPLEAVMPQVRNSSWPTPIFGTLLAEPIQPGQLFSLTGTALSVVAHMPAAASVGVAKITGWSESDGEIGGESVGYVGFKLNPIPARLPRYALLHIAPGTPMEFSLKVRISREGRVLDVAPTPWEQLDAQLLEEFRTQIASWVFRPAQESRVIETVDTLNHKDGRLDTDLVFVVRLQTSLPCSKRTCPGSAWVSYVVIDLEKVPYTESVWEIHYGGGPAP